MGFEVTEDTLKKIRNHAARGLTRRQIAAAMGWSHTTLYNKLKKDVSILDALKSGEASGIADVANALFINAMTGNTTAQIFFLKNRASNEWKDRVAEITQDAPPPTRIEIVTVDGRKTD